MKRFICLLLFFCILVSGCGVKNASVEAQDESADKAPIPDGTYSADFKTDSSMFHINEANKGKGILTVKDGKMTIHITLPSKNTLNLFPGLAEDAEKDGAVLLQPTNDTVTYEDGTTEEVFGFDLPVPYLDDEFDCALIGKKGKWYDHKVSVSNAVKITPNGEYTMAVTMTGGTGKASISSPAKVTVKDGIFYAGIVWSSTHYEYMEIDGVRYDRIDDGGNSIFIIPVMPDIDIKVSALTTAMSEPHLIDYVLHFDGSTLK